MTRILILGAGGMLGHKLCQVYRNRFETWATVRNSPVHYRRYNLLAPDHLIGGIDVFNFDTVAQALAAVKPDVMINCVGIIKQLPTAKDPIVSLTINSLLPHQLAQLCTATGTKLIHISTDCVFSGSKGMYTEEDVSDAEDLYGRSKYLGEVSIEPHLTLRTSIIGREMQSCTGLIEWFLSNKGGHVSGFTKAIYSGFTTLALAQIIAEVIEHHPHLSGLYQVSSIPINKYDLLCLIRNIMNLEIEIEPQPAFRIDRSLNSTRFWEAIGMTTPSWEAMIHELTIDPTPYNEWRNNSYDS